MLELISPNVRYKKDFLEALDDLQNEGFARDLNRTEIENDFDMYLAKIEAATQGIGLPPGYVPMSEFWLIDDNKFIGRFVLRHGLTDNLLRVGGNIGYQIRPSERNKKYGTRGLQLLLPKARARGLKKVLITCDEDNIGSRKIIEAAGGKLENIITEPSESKPVMRFWITL